MQGQNPEVSAPAPLSAGRKVGRLILVNLASLVVIALVGEVGYRLFWNPKYWISCDRWWIGSGQTAAGKKWWPDTTYEIRGPEFRIQFHTNAQGYRARPRPTAEERPYRIAFVGDSFTEGMQVAHAETFCARIEQRLAGAVPDREVVCENFGVAATGPFEYYHRIAHDVLRPSPPDALVLGLFPGNDFTAELPDDGFKPDGHPRPDYFTQAGWGQHVLTWLNLQSMFASYLERSILIAARRATPPPVQGPWMWWSDPAIAAQEPEAPAIQRTRALLQAIDEDCRQAGTRWCILVLGPTELYASKDGESPLGRLVASWGLDVPVIDVAAIASARPDREQLIFARDRHLNEAGHAFVASEATPPLRVALGLKDR